MSGAESKTLPARQRHPEMLASLVTLYATTSRRLRVVIGVTTVFSTLVKILAVILAERVLSGDVRSTIVLGVASALVFAAGRVLTSGARVDAQCDLQDAMARALVECDVLTEPTLHPIRALFEPALNARSLITDTAPELVASLFATVAVAPILASTLPGRALAVSSIALVAVMAVLLALGRANAAVQLRVWDASQEVFDQLVLTVEGRLEIVARGAEATAMRSLQRTMNRYRTTAKRGAWTAAMLGRAPLAAGLAAVALSVVLDASYRDAVTVAVLRQALVVIACCPILLSVVTLASQLVRLTATLGPVLEVLAAPARPELGRTGKIVLELPAAIDVREATFAYDSTASPTLRDLSFEWPAGKALFIDGPNGAGKSTLLRVLLGLRMPQQGSVRVGGTDLANIDVQALRRGIAYLPQRPYLGEMHAPVRVALGSFDDDIADDAKKAALERVRLTRGSGDADILDTAIGELSAGQRQRLAIARLLLRDASIYVLDEPDANLDRAGIVLVGEIVRDLVGRGRMVAIAAHTDELASLPGVRVTLGGRPTVSSPRPARGD